MHPSNSAGEQLAIHGGAPVFERMPSLAWPPVDKPTEEDLLELYRSKMWSWNGKWEQQACTELARLHTARHAIYMVNGTVTLEACLHAAKIGAGDEVIIPALTWVATAMAVLYTGATPVFVDIEPGTMCIAPAAIAAAITPRTKAIIPVHLYGSMADLDAVLALAAKHDLLVIEDCAHAQGGRWDGRGLGSIGHMGSFSFQQSKTLSAGEGGAVITNDAELAERLYYFKHIGYAPSAKQGKAAAKPPEGLDCRNYRAIEFGPLVLRSQLAGLEELTRRRGQAADFLTAELQKLPGVRVQARGRKADAGRQSYYAFLAVLDPAAWGGASAKIIAQSMTAENLPASPTYGPVYHHQLWNVNPARYRIADSRCPCAEDVVHPHAVGLLHMLLDLPEAGLTRIAEVFAKVQRNAAQLSDIS